jgi:hypothetical protein
MTKYKIAIIKKDYDEIVSEKNLFNRLAQLSHLIRDRTKFAYKCKVISEFISEFIQAKNY